MKKQLLAMTTGLALLAGVGAAFAQTTTTTTWTNDQGTMMREYSTTNKYSSYNDPAFTPTVGMELPGTVTLYSLPDQMRSPATETYRYAIVNDSPVVVETTTRRIVHSWGRAPAGGSDGSGK